MGLIHRASALLAAAILTVPATAFAGAPPVQAYAEPAGTSEDARLLLLFRNDAAIGAELDPLDQLSRGGAVAPAALALLFTDTLDRRRLAAGKAALAALARIDRRKLSPERQISYDAFTWDKRAEVAALAPDVRALTAVRPLNHFGGLHVEFPSLIASGGAAPYDDEADYRRNLALIRAFPQVLDNAVLRMRQGMGTGVVETRLTTANMIAQIDALLAQDARQSPYTSAVQDFPAAVPAPARPALRDSYAAALESEIKPAYRRLRGFLADEYLPAARDKVGLSGMKGGAGLYRRLAERQTTLPSDPAAIHRLGLSEVARIQREMEGVKREMGFAGTLPAFFDHIRTDPGFHPRTRAELADGFAAVGKRVDALVPQYFSRVPRTKLLIEPYPAYREKFEAGGSYNQGSPDGQRPGVFFYNAYDLPSRFLTGTATLYLHEGAPGHHFQISLAQENLTLPDFQRFGGNNAYVEGWALYAETLGYPMGFYRDPMQHWGTLDDEMLRAMRLVVDTGLHTKGWSRDAAIDYMLANSGMGRSDATAEVDRYIANPAQALSYKIGALTIQRLRAKAEKALGAKFDIRTFHDQVLGSGALPLPVLEAKIDRWIAGAAR